MNGMAFLIGLGIGTAIGRRKDPDPRGEPFDIFDGLDDEEMVATYVEAKSSIVPGALESCLADLSRVNQDHRSPFLNRWAEHLEKVIAERGGEVKHTPDPPDSIRVRLGKGVGWHCFECNRDLTVALHSPSCLAGYRGEA